MTAEDTLSNLLIQQTAPPPLFQFAPYQGSHLAGLVVVAVRPLSDFHLWFTCCVLNSWIPFLHFLWSVDSLYVEYFSPCPGGGDRMCQGLAKSVMWSNSLRKNENRNSYGHAERVLESCGSCVGTFCPWRRDWVGKVLWDFDSSSDVMCKYCRFELLAWGQAFSDSCWSDKSCDRKLFSEPSILRFEVEDFVQQVLE